MVDVQAAMDANNKHLSDETSEVKRTTGRLSAADVFEQSLVIKSRESSPLSSPLIRSMMKSVMKRWRDEHERRISKKLADLRLERKKKDTEARSAARSLARKIPMDILAKDWLSDNKITAEVRVFLVEKLMPTLILGVEKLLNEVEKKKLVDSEGFCPTFNPINYLAQYLMRNNPRFSNFPEASPYARGLRKIAEDLKSEVYTYEDNKLARLKSEAKKKRQDREKAEKKAEMEKRRREILLEEHFNEWTSDENRKLPVVVVQNALMSYQEQIMNIPENLRKGSDFGIKVERADRSGKRLSLDQFKEYVTPYALNLSNTGFDNFMKHFSNCAFEFRLQGEMAIIRQALKTLFMACDNDNTGMLDRKRVFDLLVEYYETSEDHVKNSLNNPREWPVVDAEEIIDDSGSTTEAKESDSKQTSDNVQASSEAQPASKPTDSTTAEQTIEEKPSESTSEDTKTSDGVENVEGKNQTENKEPDEKSAEEVAEKQNQEETKENEVTIPEDAKVEEETKMDDIVEEMSVSEAASIDSVERAQSVLTGSAFNEDVLNLPQFTGLIEKVLGVKPMKEAFDGLIRYIRSGYSEDEEEVFARHEKARVEARSAKRRYMVDQLFDFWDVNGSGFIELDELEVVLTKWKEDKIEAFHEALDLFDKVDRKISRKDFRNYINRILAQFTEEDMFESVLQFLNTSVERSFEERRRGEARKKWLSAIDAAAMTSGALLEPVYKAAFAALFKDAEAHGRNKKISASIMMLEQNDDLRAMHRGVDILRYVACTPDDAPYVLGKVLYRDMKTVSFSAVDSGKPIHVPKVANHGGVYMWIPQRKDEKADGSFIVLPLKDHEKQVIGLVGVDTIADPHDKAIFVTHEIQFFQGVTKTLGQAIQYVDVKRKTLRITESAINWILRRSQNVQNVNVYMVEPGLKASDGLVLRRMMMLGHNGLNQQFENPPRLERKDNLFRDYLFKSVESSDTITADAYGERHMAFPLRDAEGLAVAVVDISIGENKALPPHESKEIQRMLKLLAQAHKEVATEVAGAEKTYVLEAEKEHEERRIEILFDRLMLLDLRDSVGRLDARAFAELKSYKDPPKIIHEILQAVLGIFYPDHEINGDYEEWSNCKMYINHDLVKYITTYDPTAKSSGLKAHGERLSQHLQDVPQGAVAKHGSLPAQHLFNWAFVCLSLIEHTSKMNENRPIKAISPPTTAELAAEFGPRKNSTAESGTTVDVLQK